MRTGIIIVFKNVENQVRAKIDVLLVDDHAVVRAGYKAYLSLSDQIGIIYEAERGEAVCQLYKQYQPHIVNMDLSMPGIGGFESIRRLVNRDPNCKILVFNMINNLFDRQYTSAGRLGINPFSPSERCYQSERLELQFQ
jgi:DNA-binding NarL/FixJ family response regulator